MQLYPSQTRQDALKKFKGHIIPLARPLYVPVGDAIAGRDPSLSPPPPPLLHCRLPPQSHLQTPSPLAQSSSLVLSDLQSTHEESGSDIGPEDFVRSSCNKEKAMTQLLRRPRRTMATEAKRGTRTRSDNLL
jgi:hypothetical protein